MFLHNWVDIIQVKIHLPVKQLLWERWNIPCSQWDPILTVCAVSEIQTPAFSSHAESSNHYWRAERQSSVGVGKGLAHQCRWCQHSRRRHGLHMVRWDNYRGSCSCHHKEVLPTITTPLGTSILRRWVVVFTWLKYYPAFASTHGYLPLIYRGGRLRCYKLYL